MARIAAREAPLPLIARMAARQVTAVKPSEPRPAAQIKVVAMEITTRTAALPVPPSVLRAVIPAPMWFACAPQVATKYNSDSMAI